MPGVFFLYPQQVINSSGQQFVLNNAAVTTDGYQVISGFGSNEIVVLINIKNAPSGTNPTLTFTMQEVDPIDQTTSAGASVSSAALNSAGVTQLTMSNSTIGTVKVSWHITGTNTPTFTGVNVTVLQKVAGGAITANAGTQNSNIDTGNSSTTPLGGSATFTGTGIDVSGYSSITTFVFADQAGTLNIQFSSNNINWDNIIPYNIPASTSEHVQIGPQARYFRVVYNNGSVAQGTFRLQTIQKPNAPYAPVVSLSSPVDPNVDAIITKSTIVGRSSGANQYTDTKVDQFGNMSMYLGDTPNTSLGRLRTANPLSLFANKQIYNNQPLFWDDQPTSGGGTSSTYLTNRESTQISVTQNVAGTRVRQSFRRINYQPGKSQFATLTGLLVAEGGTGNAAVNRRIGLFDSLNGMFFELTGTTMNVALRSNATGTPVTTYIAQSNWNIDKLDGTGTSGITLDVSKVQVFVIDFQLLAAGRIRYGFLINGQVFYCHQIFIANVQSGTSISTPNLPVRFEIQSLGTGGVATSSLNHMVAAVMSDGGQEDVGFNFGADMGATALVTLNDASVYTLVALQLQSSMLGASIKPTFFTAASTTANAQFKIMLVLNPTIAGAALTYAPVTNSAVQYAVGAVGNTITGGTILYSGYFQTNKVGGISDQLPSDFSIGSNIAGVSDTLVLALQPTPALSINALGSINWKEQV